MSRREAAKESRRQSIVAAARLLVQETHETGFSMRALAKEACVSVVTPYNLFGSKQAIMLALLDADFASYRERLQKSASDELDLIFDAVAIGTVFFGREPDYYRTVLAAVYGGGGKEYRTMFRGPRRAFWRGLVDDAIRAGLLAKHVQPEAFSMILVWIFFAAILEWVSGEITLAEMDTRTQYGFALALLAVATPRSRKRLQAQTLQLQNRLKRYRHNPSRS